MMTYGVIYAKSCCRCYGLRVFIDVFIYKHQANASEACDVVYEKQHQRFKYSVVYERQHQKFEFSVVVVSVLALWISIKGDFFNTLACLINRRCNYSETKIPKKHQELRRLRRLSASSKEIHFIG